MDAAYASLLKKGPRLGLFNPGIIAKAIKWLNYYRGVAPIKNTQHPHF
jgi:hypothetical protein